MRGFALVLILLMGVVSPSVQAADFDRDEVFDPPLTAEPVAENVWGCTTPEDGFVGKVSANSTADKEWMVSLFIEEQQPDIQEMVDDDEFWDRNRQIQALIDYVLIRRVIEVGDVALVMGDMQFTDGNYAQDVAAFENREGCWQISARRTFLFDECNVVNLSTEEDWASDLGGYYCIERDDSGQYSLDESIRTDEFFIEAIQAN